MVIKEKRKGGAEDAEDDYQKKEGDKNKKYEGSIYLERPIFNLQQFDEFKDRRATDTEIQYGARRKGKTVSSTHGLRLFSHVYDWVSISSDTKVNGHWQAYTAARAVNGYLNFDAVIAQYELQYDRINPESANFNPDINPFGLFIFDDVVGGKGIQYQAMESPIDRIFVNGRHAQVGVRLNTQYPKAITPKMRSNTDRTFITSQEFGPNLKWLHDELMTEFKFGAVIQMVQHYTKNHMQLVINGNAENPPTALSTPQELEEQDKYYWYKAKVPYYQRDVPFSERGPKFTLGSANFFARMGGGTTEPFIWNPERILAVQRPIIIHKAAPHQFKKRGKKAVVKEY